MSDQEDSELFASVLALADQAYPSYRRMVATVGLATDLQLQITPDEIRTWLVIGERIEQTMSQTEHPLPTIAKLCAAALIELSKVKQANSA